MFKILANSCHNGPCPTLYQDPESGDVKVQGYVTSLPEGRIPAGEDVVLIPADAWARLLADLPLSMLLRAIVGRSRRRSALISVAPAGR